MKKLSDVFVSAVYVLDVQATDSASRVKDLANKVLRTRYANYEVLIIDNGLTEAEVKAIEKLLPTVPCLRLIRLSRPVDIDTAIFAGIEASIGDFICTLYDHDPIELVPDFVAQSHENDIVFGVATNLVRGSWLEETGAKIFYWYSQRYLHIDIPNGSTYFICMSRTAANALTRSGRFMRHIRHMAKQVGFNTVNYEYQLPAAARRYTSVGSGTLASRAIDLVSNYSSHPLRVLSYFGIFAGVINIIYALYVVIVNLSSNDVAKGWTSLSLQSAFMFFILFMIIAVLAEYIGKILNETQHEPPYHIMQELSSVISIADETRRNVTK
jgi:glycosyltransferase involved in cell wall biosynthesis